MIKVIIPQHVSVQYFDDTAILLDLNKESYYALNETSASFWRALEQTMNSEEALRMVLEEYEVDESILNKDMNVLIRSLLRVGLLEREGTI